MSEPKPVLLDRVGNGIAVLRLNRPDKRNALDSAALAQLNRTLTDLNADPELRVLVISTTNPRALCAGADVSEPLDHEAGVARMAAFAELYTALEQFSAPTIAVCVGNCVGAGAELVAAVDLRVGGDNLKLAWAGARLGVPVGPARLGPLIGLARAKDLIFTGRTIGMAEANSFGLLQRTAPTGDAEAIALALAADLAQQHPGGLRVLKTMFRELEAGPRRVVYENEQLMHFQREGHGLPRG